MKPDWKDAPEWANYLAMDAGGAWYWHEKKPKVEDEEWCGKGGWELADLDEGYWEKSLEKKPKT